jgi:general secretion pathway protein A
VNLETLEAAVAELQWHEYASRTHTNLPVQLLDDTARQARPPVARVVLSLKGQRISESLLVPGRFVIGRTSDNDLQIDSKFVSRHHAQLVTTEEGTVLEDLNSTNGVYLNARRVRRHRLAEGDVVRIGMHELSYARLQPDDARLTLTTVLNESEEDTDDDGADDGEENDGEVYSSRARGL